MAWNVRKYLVFQLPYQYDLQVPSYSWGFALFWHKKKLNVLYVAAAVDKKLQTYHTCTMFISVT